MGIAKAMQVIKTRSSSWIHHTFPELRNFAWQQGYGAFSVGQQLEHHRTRTFKDEYLTFLKKRGGNLDDKYFWE
jgi:putative transposase